MYRLEQPPTPPDFSFRAPIKNPSPIFRGHWNRGRSDYRNTTEAPPRFELDRRSIFIGNLPEHTSKERVIEVFSQYGAIVTVDLVAKPSAHSKFDHSCDSPLSHTNTPTENAYNTFAFIEYSLEAEATRAIAGHVRGPLNARQAGITADIDYRTCRCSTEPLFVLSVKIRRSLLHAVSCHRRRPTSQDMPKKL